MTKMYAVTTLESEDNGEIYCTQIFTSLDDAKEYLELDCGEEGTIYELVSVLTNILKQKRKTVWRKP